MTQWPEHGARLPLWDAVYAGDITAVQNLLAVSSGVLQVNTPHGVRVPIGIFYMSDGYLPPSYAVCAD